MLEQIIQILKTAWPIRVIAPDQFAVYVMFGKWHWNIQPGVYFVVPGLMEVYPVVNTEKVCDFPQMALTTKDGVGILLDGTISYRVIDPYKARFCVESLDFTLQARSMGTICDIISRRNRSETIIQDEIKQLVRDALDEIGESFGFYVVEIDITTNIHAKGIYLSR